jgi:hypothetical protein
VASRTILACDVCGGEPAEPTSVLAGGRSHEIDLCARHAKALATALKPFLKVARSAGAAPRKSAAKKAAAKRAKKSTRPAKKASKARSRSNNVAEMRAWGQANGFEVATKGRLKPDFVAAYAAAHRTARAAKR